MELSEKSAGAVVFRVAEDGSLLYLLLLPAESKPWGFPKGKMQLYECELDTAKREIREEADLHDLTFYTDFRESVIYSFNRGQHTVTKEVVYFIAKADKGTPSISREHIRCRWTTLDEAMKLVVHENTIRILQLADEYIKTKLLDMSGNK
ncbi:MAG: NUDIX domain-containing protein [bacterium]